MGQVSPICSAYRDGHPSKMERSNRHVRFHAVMSMGFLLERNTPSFGRSVPCFTGPSRSFCAIRIGVSSNYLIIDLPPGTVTCIDAIANDSDRRCRHRLHAARGRASRCSEGYCDVREDQDSDSGDRRKHERFQCPDCHKVYDIFGKVVRKATAEENGMAFLGAVPIQIALRQASDEGMLAEVLKKRSCLWPPL